MPNQNPGLLGRKLGMTQVFDADGTVHPVTVVDVSNNTVIRVKTDDSSDGYNAIQLGFGDRKKSRTNKSMQGEFDKAGVTPRQFVQELRLTRDDANKHTAGQDMSASDVFTEGQLVDVIGTSKGSGFSGVMKRHNFAGFIRSHGTHEFFRHGGSIGTRLTPGHVFKGKKMPGQMGNERVTIQNLVLVKLDAERNLLYVRGGVPGPNGATVMVRTAVKS